MNPSRILHVLDHSLPTQSGYASRSQSILRAMIDSGMNAEALTGPKHVATGKVEEIIDGVLYRRTQIDGVSQVGLRGQLNTIWYTRKEIQRHLLRDQIDVLHSHSPCLNGLAALFLGRPLVYEMRSSWEDAAVSEGVTTEGSLRYRISRALETFVAQKASHIVVICEGLRTELVNRGISEGKISVVPNALPESMVEIGREEPAEELRNEFGLQNAKVIGFFGSFFRWEGVASLIESMTRVTSAVPNAVLLLAGSGKEEQSLRNLSAKLGLESKIVFAGRQPAAAMPSLYRLADLMVYPRVANRLTEMVTPLKPLESMAQGTVVLASDIGGHRELIVPDETGFLYSPTDRDGLANAIISILKGQRPVSKITRNARDNVLTNRRWSRVADGYAEVYRRVHRESEKRSRKSHG